MHERESLLDRFRRIRNATERLAAPLSPEDCAAQSMPDASPAKWHLAHTSWFFETFALERAVPGYRPFAEPYRVLFNSYYNGVGEQHPRPQRGLLTRPLLEEVLAYRRHVDRLTERLLEKEAAESAELAAVIDLGLHHEQQHQELLLTDVKHLFSRNPLRPAYREDLVADGAPDPPAPPAWASIEGGVYGCGFEGAGFHFDNETPRHEVLLQPAELATRPVTNGEYLEFIADDGYGRPELWLSDGWAAVSREGWRAPGYWEPEGDGWMALTLGGLRALDVDEPVCHVSYYEADAYARWRGARLPREAEWEVVAAPEPVAGHWADEGRLHPRPASAGAGVQQLFGDVWEWTASAYEAYPGFRPAVGAIGEYNGKFMCSQQVLRGGSCATPAGHVRASYRNFFYPDARWQFSGIRLARDA